VGGKNPVKPIQNARQGFRAALQLPLRSAFGNKLCAVIVRCEK
jgi:hypothetical protein